MTPDYAQLTPFCRYLSFVAASFSSFSKIVFFALLSFLAGGIGYVSRSLWSIRGLRRFTTASSPTPSSGGNSGSDGGSGRPCTGCFRSSCPANVGAPAFHDLCRIHGCVRRATDTEHGNHDVCCDRCSLTSGQFHTALCDAANYDLNAPPSSTVSPGRNN